jgi:protease-4
MKSFLKYTFATLCGLFAFCFISVAVVGILAGITTGSAETQVTPNSIFVLKLNGAVEERSTPDNPLNSFLKDSNMSIMGLDDILASISKAQAEPDIKGIYLEGGMTTFDSPATAQQIRDALVGFRKSGKWIVAYADNYSQAGYYVASAADTMYLNVNGMIELKGIGSMREYDTGLYEKLGIHFQTVRVGKYKSYVETLTRKDMSAEDRLQTETYQQGIWHQWLKAIAQSRKLKPEAIDQMVSDSILALAEPSFYQQNRLVDRLVWPDQMKDIVQRRLGLAAGEGIHKLSLNDMVNLPAKDSIEGEEIAVFYAYGEIVDEASSLFTSGQNIVSTQTVSQLQELTDNDNVKAVVLRVNSPGGSATGSESIWRAVQLLKAKKPVVVSMGGYAASGGYMISAGADYIFAEPTTITGSIGIFGLVPNVSGLVTDKLGITFDGTKTNRYTDFEEKLLLGKENADELHFMQSYVDRGYRSFIRIVSEGRKLPREQVNEVAQGRVWLATDALPIKLIDKIGSLDDAIKKAADLAKVSDYHTAAYPASPSWIEQLISSATRSNLDSELRSLLGEGYAPLLNARRNLQRSRLQARFPETLNF